jgi:hypothetical protein
MSELTTRQLQNTRWGQLKTERASWWGNWQELSMYFLPYNGRFFVQDRNKGYRKFNNILDNTGTRAVTVIGAGLMAGATSPARPWFRLSTGDEDRDKNYEVKCWLRKVERLLMRIFQKSNTYRMLHGSYENIAVFGTGGSIQVEDFQNVIHHYPLSVGEFAIAQDYRGNVCTIYRELEKTVGEVVKEFGKENCSKTVLNLFDRGSLDAWVRIMHVIEPREDRDPRKRDAKNMAWTSTYYEPQGDQDKTLREGGFRRFSGIVPRWWGRDGDVYGISPGMVALGDTKQLQIEQLRKSQGIDFMTNPPLQVPGVLKDKDVDRLPGGITYTDLGPNSKIQSLFDVPINLQYLLEDIHDVRERINSAYFVDLFLMLANRTDTTKTATEVAELHEEKLLMLGPVLERMHNELLEPLVNNTFVRCIEANLLPPLPKELQGIELNVEFISILAQAQKAIEMNGIDRFTMSLGTMAQFKPGVLDKLDELAWADKASDILGVDPELIVPNDKVVLIQKQRQQDQAQAQQAAQLEQASKSVRNLGATPTGNNSNAFADLMSQYTGYGSPSPEQYG